jgi:O-antigen/teichoic acid export membrane protein
MTAVSAAVARAIGVLSSLITLPLTYRYLGAEQYGLWMLLVSMIAFMGFADLGIGLGLVNAISEACGKEDRDLAKEYFTSACVLLLGIAMILALAAIIAFPFIPWMRVLNVRSHEVATEGARAFGFLYTVFIISVPLSAMERALVGQQRGYISQSVAALGNVFSLLMLLLTMAFHGDLVWLVIASTLGKILSMSLNGVMLFKESRWLVPDFRRYRNRAAKRVFNLGLMYFVLQSGVAINFTADNIVIAQLRGAAAVAVYSVPQKLFGIISAIIGMAVAPLWPAFSEANARGDHHWVRRTFWRSLWATFAFTVPLYAVLILVGPWMLRTLFGRTLQAPHSLIVALAVWGVVGSISNVTSTLLSGAGVLKPQALLVVIVSPVNLALSVLLTIRFGVIGVCLGSIAAQTLITLPTYAWLISRCFRENHDNRLRIEVSSQ